MKLRRTWFFATAVAASTSACGSSTSSRPVHMGSTDAAADGAYESSSSASSPVLDAGSSDAPLAPASSDATADGGCGYQSKGTPLHVADGVDLCMPPVVCTSETCPPPLGSCVDGKCAYAPGYDGVQTLPNAWVTYYCQLSTGGCNGVTQIDPPDVTAQTIASQTGQPLCEGATPAGGTCVGIAASSPMVVGNSQVATDPSTGKTVAAWGLGLTEASGLCYAISGPGGSALVALTDRCGGYCKCNGSGYQECGPCVSAPSMVPNCPCVGTAPPVASACCGVSCPTLVAECDWCASNNHPHFDLDIATFNWVCGSHASDGSCQLTHASYVPCLTPKVWPPAGNSASCGASSFVCTGPMSHQDAVPGTGCCCDNDMCPQADGSCAAPSGVCKAGSCTCGAGMPDANHASVPSTGCCCVYGSAPQPDGTCQ